MLDDILGAERKVYIKKKKYKVSNFSYFNYK